MRPLHRLLILAVVGLRPGLRAQPGVRLAIPVGSGGSGWAKAGKPLLRWGGVRNSDRNNVKQAKRNSTATTTQQC